MPFKNYGDKLEYQKSEKQKQYAMEYYKRNREKRLNIAKKWREENKEKWLKNQKEYRLKSIDKLRSYAKQYYYEHKDNRKRNRTIENINYLIEKYSKSFGQCFICDEILLPILEEHHIFGRKISNFTITLCPSHHRLAQIFPDILNL